MSSSKTYFSHLQRLCLTSLCYVLTIYNAVSCINPSKSDSKRQICMKKCTAVYPASKDPISAYLINLVYISV